MNDPFSLTTWERHSKDATIPFPVLSAAPDILKDVAEIFNNSFENALKREIKEAVRGGLSEALGSNSFDSLTRLDSQIGTLIIQTEQIGSSSCSWGRLLGDHSTYDSTRSIINREQLLKRLTPSPKTLIIRSSINDALVEFIEEWFESISKDAEFKLLGESGWILSLIFESLNVSSLINCSFLIDVP